MASKTLRAAAAAALAATLVSAAGAAAESPSPGVLVAADAIRVGVVLEPRHLARAGRAPESGETASIDAVLGLETRVALYRGRAVRPDDLAPPTLVERNAVVSIVFRRGGLTLRSEGRSLDRGGAGDRVRVMNLDSRRTVYGVVAGPDLVEMR